MSQKIDDILDVLTLIRSGYRPGQPYSAKEARIRATYDLAEERGVTHQTIRDAYLRRLKPDINGTSAFDKVVREWLNGESNTLRWVLEKHALDREDELAIRDFFE